MQLFLIILYINHIYSYSYTVYGQQKVIVTSCEGIVCDIPDCGKDGFIIPAWQCCPICKDPCEGIRCPEPDCAPGQHAIVKPGKCCVVCIDY